MTKDPITLLLIGPPGAGKTTLALQFPRPGLIDLDRNTRGPLTTLKKLKPDLTFVHKRATLNDAGEPIEVNEQVTKILTSIVELKKDPSVDTIIFDGLTSFDYILCEYITKASGKPYMDLPQWGPFRQEVLRMTSLLKNSGKNVIVLCHEEYKYGVDPKNMGKEIIVGRTPALGSKLKDQYGGFFTDVWRIQASPGPLNRPLIITVETIRTGLDDLKNSYALPGRIDVTEKGFAAINEYIKLV